MARLHAFGPYQLVERIGVGAMGEVYRAVARRDGKVVALKRLGASATGNAEAVAMLEAEAELGRVLDHPSIAKVADMGQVEGVHYIAYDYVHGRDLRAIQDRALRKGIPPPSAGRRSAPDADPPEPVPLDVAVHIVLRVAEALAHAHGRKDRDGKQLRLVHRDVSPTNVLISFDGAVKLLDFGIARTAGRLVRTDAGQIKGTVGYMSPEQIRGEPLDARSDVYSLGVCFWELAAARRLVDPGQPAGVPARILAVASSPPAGWLGAAPSPRSVGARVSEELERVILKALAQSRDERYATTTEFHADLSRQAAAEGLLADSGRVARYVRKLFPEAAAEEAASREESPDMADNKGGSDLDVFEGLAKKASRPTAPGLTPPPPSQARKSTLLGGLGPLPPPVAPPSSKSAPPGPLPAPLPPPSKVAPLLGDARPPTLPPVAPPPAKSGTLHGLAAPPAPLPPPSRLPAPSAPSGAPAMPPMPAAAALPPPPPAASAAPAIPPPPPAVPPPPKPGAPFPPAPSAALAAPPLPSEAKPPPPLPPPAPLPGAAAKPLPPPMAPPKEKSGKAAVDMDWDDEEESTHVYDKDGDAPIPTKPAKVGAAAALLASSGGTARSAAPPPQAAALPSVPPPPPPVPAVPVEPMLRRDEPTAIRPRPLVATPAPQGTSRLAVLLGGAALVVALVVLAVTLMPKKGAIKINVAARNGAPIGAVDVYIDGQKRCEATPCVLSELETGEKTIKVIAAGYLPAESRETIEASKEKVITVPIETSGGVAVSGGGLSVQQPASTGGGPVLKIAGTEAEKGVHVLVDGADKGTLPIEIKDVPAGTHKVRFEGSERYEKSEQSVDLTAGQVKDLGEIKLKVVKGQVTLDIVTKDVAITLVRRGDKKTEKKITDAMLKNPPVKIDIDTSESWRLVATKKGFDDFTQDLTFEDGQADKTVKIELFEIGKPPPPVNVGGPVREPPPTREPPATHEPAAASGNGTLNINSIPVSKVILDGKPLGSTPKVGVSVPAGSHTVTFIHPDLGKQSVTVHVKNGETKTAAVKFKQP